MDFAVFPTLQVVGRVAAKVPWRSIWTFFRKCPTLRILPGDMIDSVRSEQLRSKGKSNWGGPHLAITNPFNDHIDIVELVAKSYNICIAETQEDKGHFLALAFFDDDDFRGETKHDLTNNPIRLYPGETVVLPVMWHHSIICPRRHDKVKFQVGWEGPNGRGWPKAERSFTLSHIRD